MTGSTIFKHYAGTVEYFLGDDTKEHFHFTGYDLSNAPQVSFVSMDKHSITFKDNWTSTSGSMPVMLKVKKGSGDTGDDDDSPTIENVEPEKDHHPK